MSLADDLDAPIPVRVGDQTLKLGILTLDDLAAVEREIVQARVDAALAELPNSHTADDVQRVRASVGGLTVEGLSQHIFAVGGCIPFLARQLVAGGSAKDLDEGKRLANVIGRRKGWREAAILAGDASGLFPSPEELRAMQARPEGSDPNAGAGNSPAA